MKKMNSVSSWAICLILTVVFAGVTSQSQLRDDGLTCEYVTPIQEVYLANHVKFSNKDKDVIQPRVVDQYIKSLDPSKIYLLQSDVEKIKDMMKNLFSQLSNKNCKFVTDAQGIVLSRMKERVQFVKNHLADPKFKIDPTTEFLFDPDKRVFAKNTSDVEEYLKKYIQFQVANYVANDTKMDEAKANVIKNYERVLKRYQEISKQDQIAAYIDSFARSLDPHSDFFSPSSYADFRIDMNLELEGIGATLTQEEGFTVITDLVPGGPAFNSGLIEPKDMIISVGQENGKVENVVDLDLKDVVSKIRGKKGTKVTLTILRKQGDGKKRFDITIVRDKIKLEDSAAKITYVDREINGQKKKLGILNLPSFYADDRSGKDKRTASADVKKLLLEAKANGTDGIVLDLSTNGGGSLTDAVEIAGLFFKTGNVVKQSSKYEEREEGTLADTDPSVVWSGPLVVLTSRVSASASEIVSGALQDYKRAVIVGGDHTWGKGTIQTVRPVPGDRGALKVTIGMFFIPGGYSTQHGGVSADVVLPSVLSNDEMGEKNADYSLPPRKIAPFISQSAFVKDGPEAWREIQPNWIKALKEKSQVRVSGNEEFKKIVEEISKQKEKGRVIKVSEILNEKNDKDKKDKKLKAKNMSKEEKQKEYMKRPDINEAENVLLDLMTLADPKLAAK